ncbi:MAG: SMC-Scp complex subunit ScpB [Pirellulaceae bacterium]|nr:SMC-Scp complex subunit ScpB [Pirellulaceae bacterium]
MNENEDLEEQDHDTDELAEDGIELSLDELGRAYARASGLEPEEIPETLETEPVVQDDDAHCELSPKSILEAILFVGSTDPDEPLTTRKIASWIRGVSPKEITQLAKELQQDYEQTGSAFRVLQDRNQLRLIIASDYEIVRESFYGEARKAKLSQQAIDVLAIVAYNQPIKKEDVNELRSRDCGSILNQLVKRKLLDWSPDQEKAKLKLYHTTDRFLDLFGLESIEDLPQSEEFSIPD